MLIPGHRYAGLCARKWQCSDQKLNRQVRIKEGSPERDKQIDGD